MSPTIELVLEDVALRVPMLGFEQIVDTYYEGDVEQATEELRECVARKILLGFDGIPIRRLEPDGPFAEYDPDDDDHPDCKSWEKQLRARWEGIAPTPTTVFAASKLAAATYGSWAPGKLGLPKAWDHDYLLGTALCHWRKHRPEDVDDWVGEQARRKNGFREKDPDAYISDHTIVDSAGLYSSKRVLGLINHSDKKAMHLELW